MNLIDLLKGKKRELLDANKNVTPTVEEVKEPKIEVVIEDATNIFKNEEEILLKSGKEFLENGLVDSLEDGIITCATMLRGLRYRRTEKDDDGNTKIIFKDISLNNDQPKSL